MQHSLDCFQRGSCGLNQRRLTIFNGDKFMNQEIKNELFKVRTLGEWIDGAKRRPTPKKLFGEFWLEGEIAIMFADTGKGKSILAVQIAESLATGKSIDPLVNQASPQTALYLDFELTDKQFEMRYAEESEETGELTNHYQFPDNCIRAEVVTLEDHPQPMYKTFDEYLVSNLNKLLRATTAKVLIIDNLTYLRQKNEQTGEAVRLMKALKDLRKAYGLSILVLAHTPKRAVQSPLSVNDLQGSKILSNFADNIFAIGGSATDSDVRYLKHIKLRSTEMSYDALNVPTFRIRKRDGNFLAFHFLKFEDERSLIDWRVGSYDEELMQKIREAAAQGMGQRPISTMLGVSKTTVNRYLRLPLKEEKMRPISQRSIEAARQQMIYDAARRQVERNHEARMEEERQMAERGMRSAPAAASGEPPVAVPASGDEFDDACDCFQCTSGSPENCLDTNWAEQCCDGTDPDCCAKDALI
jgi:hypothetical protein